MAFDLRPENLTGLSVITQPANTIAGPDNFIDLYTYAMQYMPHLIPQLHMANGKGSITGFLSITGQEGTYESDQVEHMELGRLHNTVTDVARAGNVFTSPIPHNLSADDIGTLTVKFSDGAIEGQGTLTAVTSATVFEATNDAGGAWAFTGNVDAILDFSNSYGKGTEDAKGSKRWDPTPKYNYSHVLKVPYKVSASDMAHRIWVNTPMGPRWFNLEVERSSTLFDNEVDMTQIFHERKASGTNRGVIGVIPRVEADGNVANERIEDVEELSEVAFRIKQQSPNNREYMFWHDHAQSAAFRRALAGTNAYYTVGANYGTFQNKKDMALMLDFKTVFIDGVTFHAQPWNILDDPTLMGNEKFRTSGVAGLLVPSGRKPVMENGNSITKPYLSYRYRSGSGVNFKKEIKLFGPHGTPHKEDTQITHFKSEFTNQLVGANEWFVIRAAAGYYN